MHSKMDWLALLDLRSSLLSHRLQRSNQMFRLRDVAHHNGSAVIFQPHFFDKKKECFSALYIVKNGGGRWIRTIEVGDSRFTVCPLWPLGNSTTKPKLERVGGVEPPWPAWKAGAQPLCHTRRTSSKNWYRRWDLNPHSLGELGPEPSASANSATSAFLYASKFYFI